MDSDLIKLVNKLQDTFHNLGGELDMPQLVVVGSQSAGKSSVLETIVGRDFLPRGSGIVTRRPLVLQLIHSPVPEDNPPPYTEWGQFLHLDKRFTDFDEIRKEIEQETLRVAGQNKGISKLPISLRIFSPNVLDLTLVDLPGLTKIPVGDQPSDIERQIRNLVSDYISKANSVILAVSPANVDLANSESLKLARSVDPQGRRTIGVLTKLDLMDAGTNALDILTGRVYPLKLGFIGVVNRSQQDINSSKSMSDALESETEFFKNHPAYRNIAHKNGTKYLAQSLNKVLMNHIREKLPDMKARLNTLMGQAQQELNSFGDAAVFGDKNQQGGLILRLMTQFARDFISSIEGTNVDVSTKELSGGARIYYIFNDVFGQALLSLNATQNLDNQDIRTAIRNSTGPRPSLFVPEVAFDLLVKPQIKLLEAPSLRCVELVYEELVKICHNCTSVELQRFPRLHAQLIEVVSDLLRERLGPTSEYTQSLIDIQAAYINTNHPAFIAGSAMAAAQAQSPPRIQPPPRPASAEPLNGHAHIDDDEADVSDSNASTSSVIPPRSDARSVSSTVHDRTRTSTSKAIKHPKHMSSHHPSQPPPRPHSSTGAPGSSPPSARETFLNLFFGQNGTAPVSNSAAAERTHPSSSSSNGIVPIGRDISGEDPSLTAGIMSGTRAMDGNSTAYEMKSLGRHIEAIPTDGSGLTMREEMEVNLIRSLITSYFGIVRQMILDLVPKAIMHLLVNHTSQQVQNRLVASLYKPELFAEMLNEDEALVAERTRVKALLDAYKEAFKTLSDVNLKAS
ncbi:Dynamin central region-domain-containing protein [Lentinula raphanica]|uniref:Dynamin central region-domain-containing protein n=1 Tax=Lentinula raphanica TaxID=153919 RepID=A0AA38UGT8_9AGAR|nr:Dynamin central region-domain-containing protein [Lentinula raphanica]KAJ3828302.1 Dynamin central region-domain-containing protein [Lentinula raphanica]KAJ3837662.1 Dynamin central region-domain-containing protein [Lentinula raphanica]KAJ3965441.1 Dynamin central region-domain-containing protein [Lentinula raphanica]